MTATGAAPARRGATAPYVVGLAGGTGSGKTALAQAIAAALGPERATRLSHDAYYRDRPDLDDAARAALDFDCPDALDAGLFLEHLQTLRAGGAVCPPRYCFVTHRRIGAEPAVEPREVVLVDGILLLHDVRARAALDFKIFLDVPEPVRVARRLARDTLERGRAPESVLAQLERTVRVGHATWVEPTKSAADLVLLNVGRLEALAEVATAIIRGHLDRRAAEARAA